MAPGEFLAELKKTLEACRFDQVGELIDRIDPASFSDAQIKTALNLIRRKRLFAELEKAAGLFIVSGRGTPVVRRQWAQALLDENRIAQGLAVLNELLTSVAADPNEGPEVRGLIGRAYKQRFVNQGAHEDLKKAILTYREDWRADPTKNRWHGINLVALLKRAEREGVATAVDDDANAIARSILGDIDSLDDPNVWDYGTALEAAVALGDKSTALKWAKNYATHPRADAFELGSTLRQMREIWQLDGTDVGNSLLPVLQFELLQREGAACEVTLPGANSEGFQSVYGSEGVVNLEWLETMFARCQAIARVFDPVTGTRWGTGFLVRGSDLYSGWSEKPVFVTNSHVVSDNPADEAPLHPGEGSAEFTRLAGRPSAKLGKLLFTSPRVELDVSVLEISAPAGVEPLKPSVYAPALAGGEAAQRIYVVGHPEGGELAVSLYDNNLAEYEGCFVRYRSPTKGGSSGSPVFSRRWQPFAIHHRTREEMKLNEGVLFEAIKSATLKAK